MPKSAKLSTAGWIAIIVLFGFLFAALWYAVHTWNAMAGVVMSPLGWFFLALGVIFTIAVGGGLMYLVFYSSRHGMDR